MCMVVQKNVRVMIAALFGVKTLTKKAATVISMHLHACIRHCLSHVHDPPLRSVPITVVRRKKQIQRMASMSNHEKEEEKGRHLFNQHRLFCRKLQQGNLVDTSCVKCKTMNGSRTGGALISYKAGFSPHIQSSLTTAFLKVPPNSPRKPLFTYLV